MIIQTDISIMDKIHNKCKNYPDTRPQTELKDTEKKPKMV